MNKSGIGIFDSGLGGLTVVKELHNLLPYENIVYFGDTGRVPYGTRSKETIIKYAKQDISFLMSQGVKAIIAACGTVSSVTDYIKEFSDVPFINVIDPTAASAVKFISEKHIQSMNIGVIGTSATIKSHVYLKKISELQKNINVFEKACPLFVPLVENGVVSKDDPVLLEIARRYLSDFKNLNIDVLILGCTHYPIISDAISSILGSKVGIISSGRETAIYAAEFLKSNNMLNNDNSLPEYLFYVSDEIENFSEEAMRFLNLKTPYKIKKVDITKFCS
jgi:glutamate racemase